MEFALALAYSLVYLAGYYGAHMLNLAMRRVVFSNLRVAGLIVLATSAMAFAYLIGTRVPEGGDTFSKGYVQGAAIGPALLVGVVVAVRMWMENRRLGKVKRPGQ